MATINQLSSLSSSEVNSGDNLPIYSSSNGDARKMSLSTFLTWLKSNFARQDYTTTINVPVTGFSYSMTEDGLNRYLCLRPAGTLATGTIVLPAITYLTDGQEYLFTSTQTITTLTVDGSDATAVVGAPSTMGATSPFRLRYNKTTTSWYLVA
jgi:hypothetical protein